MEDSDSIQMFKDFPESCSELTDEKRHEKRIKLEERIFTMLKTKYLDMFKNFWESYSIPRTSEKCIVIVERRIHPNLEFIIYNAAYFARGWSMAIVCSDTNIDYIREIVKGKDVHLLEQFKGDPDPKTGKDEYNALLQNASFYMSLPSENLLMMEMDTYLRMPIPDKLLQYDYIAAPYGWDTSMQGGGLSFRKKSAMINVCMNFKEKIYPQDIFAYKGIKALNYSIPPFEEAVEYFTESCLYEDPIGFHQWWTYFSLDEQEDDYFFRQYVTLCTF
jgi:hypothetical protein